MSDKTINQTIPVAYQLGDYGGSRDYEKLADLSMLRSIVCIVDYDGEYRDVARTTYSDHHGDGCWNVSARGISYITAFSRSELLAACKRNNLEFIEPSN